MALAPQAAHNSQPLAPHAWILTLSPDPHRGHKPKRWAPAPPPSLAVSPPQSLEAIWDLREKPFIQGLFLQATVSKYCTSCQQNAPKCCQWLLSWQSQTKFSVTENRFYSTQVIRNVSSWVVVQALNLLLTALCAFLTCVQVPKHPCWFPWTFPCFSGPMLVKVTLAGRVATVQ